MNEILKTRIRLVFYFREHRNCRWQLDFEFVILNGFKLLDLTKK